MSFEDDDQDDLCAPPNEEEELSLPRASINKMIKEIVSFNLKLSKSQQKNKLTL